MSKFTDAIKGFINKHFTQEVTCANCGKTGKIMFFSKLKDENRICSACKGTIPYEFDFKAKESTLEDFKELYDFMQYTNNELEPIFDPDDDYSYGSFEVDPVHYLCRVDGSFVFEISNIMVYNFVYQPEEFKDGVFSSKVKGDVHMTGLILRNPAGSFGDKVIKHGAKGKAEKKVFSSTITYQNPKDMDEFMFKFDSLWSKFESEREEKELNDLVEQKARELLAQRENN
ncbi:MAG: hypothetical protein IJZ63_04880 [Clostridia bacterium]|nr:hypothetical protein [Clostridia bacterium]